MAYTYFPADEGGYIGFFDKYPDAWTEGESVGELETMLVSLYEDFNDMLTDEDTKSEFLPASLCHGSISIRSSISA
jgi:predicted RNase H-like HicB family nuclease